MAINSINNITQMILYYLFFVRRNYLLWSSQEKESCSAELVRLLKMAWSAERDEWGTKGKYWGLLKKIIAMFRFLSADEIENMSHFLSESPFLFVFCEYFEMLDGGLLGDDSVMVMMKSLINDAHRGAVGCAIYDRCRRYSQRNIREYVGRKIEELPFWVVSKGLFTGAVMYDEKIHMIIGREIVRMSEEDPYNIDEDSQNSPVFTIMRLFKWGMITEYELNMFDEYCQKSSLLMFMIYPDFFPKEMIMEGWSEILIHPRYRKCAGYRL